MVGGEVRKKIGNESVESGIQNSLLRKNDPMERQPAVVLLLMFYKLPVADIGLGSETKSADNSFEKVFLKICF